MSPSGHPEWARGRNHSGEPKKHFRVEKVAIPEDKTLPRSTYWHVPCDNEVDPGATVHSAFQDMGFFPHTSLMLVHRHTLTPDVLPEARYTL